MWLHETYVKELAYCRCISHSLSKHPQVLSRPGCICLPIGAAEGTVSRKGTMDLSVSKTLLPYGFQLVTGGSKRELWKESTYYTYNNKYTPPKSNIEANNWWFVDVSPFPRVYVSGSMLLFWGVSRLDVSGDWYPTRLLLLCCTPLRYPLLTFVRTSPTFSVDIRKYMVVPFFFQQYLGSCMLFWENVVSGSKFSP